MRTFLYLAPFLAVLSTSSLVAATADTTRIKSIIRAFEVRESSPEIKDPGAAHRAWLASPQGKDDVAHLTAHFDSIPSLARSEMVTELARTGVPEILPFINRALTTVSDGLDALPGIFYACHLVNAGPEYRKGLAEAVAQWCLKSTYKQESAIKLLPHLDGAVALRTLLSTEFLSADSPHALEVLEGCNEARLVIPLDRIEPLLSAWSAVLDNPKSEYRLRRSCGEAVRALAAHQPARAIALAEKGVKTCPDVSNTWSSVILAAAGLTGLYERLCDFHEPTLFATLPEPAKIYFSVTYFGADCDNGGIGQALGNPTGDFYPWVKKGYEAIGDKRATTWLAAMCKPFGEAGPGASQEERLRQMKAMKPDYWEQEDALYDEWAKGVKEDNHPGEDWLLATYAVRHADVLRPLLTIK